MSGGVPGSWVASWGHLGSKRLQDESLQKISTDLGAKLEPSWGQVGAKLGPSWSQVGAKLDASWSQDGSREAPEAIFWGSEKDVQHRRLLELIFHRFFVVSGCSEGNKVL